MDFIGKARKATEGRAAETKVATTGNTTAVAKVRQTLARSLSQSSGRPKQPAKLIKQPTQATREPLKHPVGPMKEPARTTKEAAQPIKEPAPAQKEPAKLIKEVAQSIEQPVKRRGRLYRIEKPRGWSTVDSAWNGITEDDMCILTTHYLLLTGAVKEKTHCLVATITSTVAYGVDKGNYVSIDPLPGVEHHGPALQLVHHGGATLDYPAGMALPSYVRIDRHFRVPLNSLIPVVNKRGGHKGLTDKSFALLVDYMNERPASSFRIVGKATAEELAIRQQEQVARHAQEAVAASKRKDLVPLEVKSVTSLKCSDVTPLKSSKDEHVSPLKREDGAASKSAAAIRLKKRYGNLSKCDAVHSHKRPRDKGVVCKDAKGVALPRRVAAGDKINNVAVAVFELIGRNTVDSNSRSKSVPVRAPEPHPIKAIAGPRGQLVTTLHSSMALQAKTRISVIDKK